MLLGLDNIRKLQAKFDFVNDTLVTTKRTFKIYYLNVKSKLSTINNLKVDLSAFRVEHLNDEEKFGLAKVIQKFKNIIYDENSPLTFTNQIKHFIRTTDDIPVYTKQFRLPEIHRAEIENQISNLLAQNIIEPSYSPWSSPLWLVSKKPDASGKPKWRLVTDFRKVNLKTINDKYPIPNINEILYKLGKCNYFSTIDLASGFHQIEMNPADKEKTAFNTDHGHYQYRRMPFGLKNAPSTFQRVMDNILRGLLNKICLVYLDDIIVFASNLKEHLDRLNLVFDRLNRANFKIQLDKCEFLKREVAFLGHIVTPEGVKPNPDKIKAIKNFPIPTTAKQIKSFLGLLGYYRKFIANFAKLTKPLTKLTKKHAKINISDIEYKNCFEDCKKLLTNEPLLQYPDYSKKFNITTDASDYAIGAVLSQGPMGQDKPIAYASRTLNPAEINYSTIEKELLAIVYATKYFRPYIFGRKFDIFSDHKPLQWLFNMKDPNSKFIRWRTKLSEYDFDINYKKGSTNYVADSLSRNPAEINVNVRKTIDLYEWINNPQNLTNPIDPMEIQNLERELQTQNPPTASPSTSTLDPIELLNQNYESPVSIDPDLLDELDQQLAQNLPSNSTIKLTNKPLNYFQNQIHLKIISLPTTSIQIKKLFNKKLQRFIVNVSEQNFESDIINFLKQYTVPSCNYYIYSDARVLEKLEPIILTHFTGLKIFKTNKLLKDIEDPEERTEILENYHSGKTNHRGISETHEKLKDKYFWPKLKEDITEYVNNCDICQKSKYDRHPLKLELNLVPTAKRPFEIIHLDSLAMENQKFLTIVDSFSKFAQAYPLKSLQPTEIVDKLLEYFSLNNIPKLIISDNGGEFKNNLLQEFLKLHKIDIRFTCPQNPSSNGIVERFHSTLIEHIRLFNNRENFKNQPIATKVLYALIAYNNTKHSATKLTPFEIKSGHIDDDTPLEILSNEPLISDYCQVHKENSKLMYENIHKTLDTGKAKVISTFNEKREKLPEIPEKVFVRNKQKCIKTKNQYDHETLRVVDTKLKTGKIVPRTQNKTEKIHLSNIKRPRKLITPEKTAPIHSTNILTSEQDKIITYKRGNLFNAPPNYSLAHCVAADLKMSAGIAVTFRQKFNNIEILRKQKIEVGGIGILKQNKNFTYYLVTKQVSHDKPKVEDLKSCLIKLKRHCMTNNITKLAIPKIGCGLDKLNWYDVEQLINTIFRNTKIKFLVYSPND